MAKKRQNKNQQNDQAPEQDIIQEAGLPANWQPIDVEPLIPSAPKPGATPPLPNAMPSHFVGTLNPDMQHDTMFVGTQVASPRIASTPLMPAAPSGNPQTNAAIRSTITLTTSKTSSTDQFVDIETTFRGVWRALTAYNTNDIVIFNGSAYVALTASTNLQPDNNHDAGPAEGVAAGSPAWTLLSENLVFNSPFSAQFNVGGLGPIDAAGVTGASGSSTAPTITATSSGTFLNEIAIVYIGNDNSGFTFTPPAGWNLLYTISGSARLYWKAITGGSTVTFTATLSAPDDWEVLIEFFGFGGFAGFPITQIQTSSTVLTVTAANSLVAGNVVAFSGLTNATFLNGQLGTVASATATQFTVNSVYGNPGYGPTADTGTASLQLLQVTALVSGSGPAAVGFTQATTKGSTFLYTDLWEGHTGASGAISSLGDNNTPSNVYTFTNTDDGACIGSAQNQGALSTPTITPLSTGLQLSAGAIGFELPGSVQNAIKFIPYDVVEFRGSIFVCLAETSLDAFAAPSKWGLIGPATGYTQVKTADYTATQSDEGNLLSFNSSSAHTLKLPNPIPLVNNNSSADSGWYINVENIGSGALTVSPNGLTLDGSSSSLVLNQNQGCMIFTDGVNFFTVRGAGSSAGGVNVQTMNYTAAGSDNGKLISFNGSNLTLTLPNPPISTTWFAYVQNLNSTNLTISRNGLNIDGAASNLTLGQNQGVIIFTDGTNYFTEHGVNSLTVPSILTASAPDGSGNVVVSLANENAKTALMGPVACSSAAPPTFRQPQGTDLANLNIASASGTNATTNQSGNFRLCGAVLPAGLYRVSMYVVVTVTGTGNISMTVTWNDGTASQSYSPSNITTTVLGTIAQFDIVVLSDGVHDVSWSISLI